MTTTPTPDEALRAALEARMAELQSAFPLGSLWVDRSRDCIVTISGHNARPGSYSLLVIGGDGRYRPDELRPVPPPPVRVRERWAWLAVTGDPFLSRNREEAERYALSDGIACRWRIIDGHLVLCHPDPDANGDPIPMTVEAWEGES